MILFEAGHYWLLALSIAVFSTGIWLSWTGTLKCVDDDLSIHPARLVTGACLIVIAVVLLGIFQDVRLDHLCAIHGNCR